MLMNGIEAMIRQMKFIENMRDMVMQIWTLRIEEAMVVSRMMTQPLTHLQNQRKRRKWT